MGEPLPPDFFTSLDQNPFPLSFPLGNSLEFYTPFDASALLASSVDTPRNETSTSSGSDNDSITGPISPLSLTPRSASDLPIQSPFAPVSLPFPLNISSPVKTETPPETIGKRQKSSSVSEPVPVPSSVVKELLQEQDLKRKRLARKAELARVSRRRKKTRMGDLEKQVAELECELARVKEEAKSLAAKNAAFLATRKGTEKGKDPEKTIEKAVEDVVTLMATASDKKIDDLLCEVVHAFKRQSTSMEFCIRSLEQSLVPCMALQFLEWTLIQRDKFYQEETGLFMSLFRDEMGATPEQIENLLSLRNEISKDQFPFQGKDNFLVESFRAFKKLLKDQGRLRQMDTFAKLHSIFTPRQLATYLKWVNQYGHVLVKVPV